ncbi:peptidoglycan editing factor PgeF [Myxococcota bacterium]|nr:peptidoglycan editing factor PgeF [Myxococcota bacterium]
MILASPMLSAIPFVRHGFSTRLGGVSSGPFATLNLDRGVGDDDAAVAENRRRFLLGLGAPGADLVQVHQVHGTAIVDEATVDRSGPRPEGDALVCTRPGVVIGVRTADCVPILVVAKALNGRPLAVAAIHAGWRGATAGILGAAIEKLEALGAKRRRMFFALGPAIGRDAFEVGPEVIDAARASLGGEEPPHVVSSTTGKPHLDLFALLERQLARLDVSEPQYERVGGCTHDQPALFFSHRRDRGRTGRHLAAITWVP